MKPAGGEQKLYINKDYYTPVEPSASSSGKKQYYYNTNYYNADLPSTSSGGRGGDVRRQYRKKKDPRREFKYVPKDQLNTKSEQREKITSIITNMFEMENFVRNK